MTEPGGAAPPGRPRLDPENPWPGLYAYDEDGKEFFKGRSDAAQELLRLVTRDDLVLLYGISGLGKTSLIRAGLVPILPRHVLPIYVRLSWVREDATTENASALADTDDLRRQVFAAVAHEARLRGVDPPARPPGQDLWEYFRRADDPFWGRGGLLMTPLLIFDQFEELFTHGGVSESAAPRLSDFLHDLGAVVSGRAPQWYERASAVFAQDPQAAGEPSYTLQPGVCKLLLSFREDYLASVKSLSCIVPAIDRTFLRLLPMTREAASAAVLEAGKGVIDQTDPRDSAEIVTLVIDKVAGAHRRAAAPDTVDPALLSLFCRELNERRKTWPSQLIDAELVRSGEAGQIIGDFYRETMKKVGLATQRFVEEQMVLPDSRSRWPSARVRALSSGVPEEDLAFLIDKRILRPDDSGGVARLELTHDVLVDVVLDERARREEKDRADRVRGRLEAEARQARETLLDQQRTARRQRKRLIILGTFGVVALLIIVALVGAIASISKLERSQRAQTLARAAGTAIGDNPQLATVFALRAVEESGGFGSVVAPVTETALNRSVRESHLAWSFKPKLPALSATLSPDRQYLAVLSFTKTEVQLQTGEGFSRHIDLGQRSADAGIFAVRFTADSQQLVILYQDTAIERVNLRVAHPVREPLAHPEGPQRGVSRAGISADGTRIMIYSTRADAYDTGRSPQSPAPSLSVFDATAKARLAKVDLPDGATVAVSANADAYAVATPRGVVSVIGADGGVIDRRNLGELTSVEISPNGRHVVGIRRESPGIVVWSVRDHSPAPTWSAGLPSTSPVLTVSFSPDGSIVAARQERGVLFAWDVRTKMPVFVSGVLAEGTAFSDDSRELLTWDRANMVDVWDLASGLRLLRFAGHRAPIVGASILPRSTEGPAAVTIAGDEIYVWNRLTVDTVIAPTPDQIVSLVSNGGTRLAAVTANHTAIVADTPWRPVDSIALNAAGTSVALSRDGERVAIGTATREVIVKTIGGASRGALQRLQADGEITAVAFGTDNDAVVYAARDETAGGSTVVMKSLASGTELLHRKVPGQVVFMSAEPNGRGVAVGLYQRPDYAVQAEPLEAGGYGQSMKGSSEKQDPPQVTVQFLALGRDAAAGNAPGDVTRPSAPQGGMPGQPRATSLRLPDAYGPQGRGASARGEPRMNECESATGGLDRDFARVVWATGCAEAVTVWTRPAEPQVIPLSKRAQHVAMAPDGRHFAVAALDGSITLYHTETQADPIPLESTGPTITALAFVAQGEQLAALRSDRTIALYPFGAPHLETAARAIAQRYGDSTADCTQYVGDRLTCQSTSQWRLIIHHIMPWWSGK